ncbi:hypothetical protein DL770_003629 [Monosporascus sp. CRB-9-2]|nr:hypothetical protein DL770_003629 [Monosporascus sp. CRB-9-2]
MSLLSPHFVLQEVTRGDIIIASLAWGFTIGFGWLSVWTAMKQSWQAYKRTGRRVLRNGYVWMIWLEVLVCLGFGIICFLYLLDVIPPSFIFYFSILTLWALQVQFLLQIIINRCSLLIPDKRFSWRLKVGVAVLITAINISVYNIWIPARLQISEKYIHINEWWDRCEKVIYLLVDAALNFYFIAIVRRNLVQNGLQKYNRLVQFNMFIIGFSLSMDVLIISMMSLKNTFVYMQFHPLAYMVKLHIEMSMAELIGNIAKEQNSNSAGMYNRTFDGTNSRSGRGTRGATGNRSGAEASAVRTQITAHVGDKPMELNEVVRPVKGDSESDSSKEADADHSYHVHSQGQKGIYTTREISIEFENVSSQSHGTRQNSFDGVYSMGKRLKEEDETPLRNHQAGLTLHGATDSVSFQTRVQGTGRMSPSHY